MHHIHLPYCPYQSIPIHASPCRFIPVYPPPLQELYRAAKARFDEDEDFKLRARQAVTELQGGRPEYVAAWKRICAASRREFEAIYSRLGVELQERGESFYNPALKGLVAELEGQGIAEESEGCSVVFVEVRGRGWVWVDARGWMMGMRRPCCR